MRILRQKIRRIRADIGEIAAPTTRDANLLSNRFCVINERHTTPALPRARRTKKPSRTGPDDDCVIVLLHAANVAVR